MIDASINHPTVSPTYKPAEVETGENYNVSPADIYALAITILVIMIQYNPFA
jgi:hypothetical protein